MDNGEIEKILTKVDLPIEDPRFFPKAFVYIGRRQKKKWAKIKEEGKKILFDEFAYLSRRVDDSELQESAAVRNVIRARKIAKLLISDEGNLKVEMLLPLIEDLKVALYSLGPERAYDAKRNEHMIKVLRLLQNKQFERQLKTISKPHLHSLADEIIRQTLGLSSKTPVTDAHARRAALSAWLCYLRQNVGSCFATAPGILVHGEQPLVFLKDIQEMLATGRLKRTFGGVEYAVPLSYSWGAGDLRRVYLFQRSALQEDLKIWKSPGLIAAFEKVEMISPKLTAKEKQKKCRKIIINVLSQWESKGTWFYSSLENILRVALLNFLELTEEDITEYEMRPKGMIHGGLLMTATEGARAQVGLGKKCQFFQDQFKAAKDAFKVFADNALLKTWEFTLASFAETKSQFTTWNLYTSLGLKPDDRGGIGPKLYEILKSRLEECNRKVEDLQFEYEQAYAYLQQMQRRLKRAASEDQARWLKAEYQAKAYEFNSLEETRNNYYNKARRYQHLYDGLLDLYFRLFPGYFQEIYDPDIIDVKSGPFDDSPAGFRLLFKHGRSNTSQWTLITNHSEFIDALTSFFTATESELANAPEMKGLEEDVAEIVTLIVNHVRSNEFIETAFWRMAEAHGAPLIKDPLENLEKIEKKPWVYTSGGALNTLVSCYFRLEDKPKEVSRWVENPIELLVFLIDSVKEIPANVLDAFLKNKEKSLLIHSPTHAFLLKPGYDKFAKAWQSKIFTYTWVRDDVVNPMLNVVNRIFLDDEKMQFVIEILSEQIPKAFRHYFKQSFQNLGGSMKADDFRQHILDTIELTRGLQYAGRAVLTSDQIDSTLYSLFPLFPSYQLQERVASIVSRLPGVEDTDQKRILEILEKVSGRAASPKIISATHLKNIIRTLLSLVLKETMTAVDYPLLISQIAQNQGFALETPFIFADTNWVKDHFAFVVNPGNAKFELWRMDYTGSHGAPMSDWKQWLDGTKKKPDWGVYIRPHEYSL